MLVEEQGVFNSRTWLTHVIRRIQRIFDSYAQQKLMEQWPQEMRKPTRGKQCLGPRLDPLQHRIVAWRWRLGTLCLVPSLTRRCSIEHGAVPVVAALFGPDVMLPGGVIVESTRSLVTARY